MSKNSAFYVYLFFLLIYLLTTGGRIAGSDEQTMFYVTQAIIERWEVSVPEGNTIEGREGKLYSRYGLGPSLVAIPFYLAGKAGAELAPQHLQNLAIKSVVSLTNAFVGAGACLIFFLFCLRLEYSRRFAFWLTLGFGISSFFFPYTKSFLSEPLQTLCLLGAAYGLFVYAKTGASKWLLVAGFCNGLGVLTKVTFALNVLILGSYLLNVLLAERSNRRFGSRLLQFALPIVAAGVVVLWYNYIRFGSFGETGYGQYGTMSAFSTPLYVGVYGMLLSSGKGFFWFTPLAILGVMAFRKFAEQYRREAFLFGAVVAANLLLFAKFLAWGGEGSWGPRYLVPITPFLLLPIGFLLKTGSKSIKHWFHGLVTAGFLVQLAGISIYCGTYYREIGEFPYQREFTDPLFLYQSRYVPQYSQIIGQWRMLVRNAGKFLSGEKIVLNASDTGQRIPLQDDDINQLRYTLDYWFAYARCTGLSVFPGLVGIVVLLVGIGFCLRTIWRGILP
jgi:hypothetical protein